MIAGFNGMDSDRRHFFAVRYLDVKEAIVRAGFTEEIDWQDEIRLRETTEADFLREAAWVILSAGMREAVVRSKFDELRGIFLEFTSARELANSDARRKRRALKVFNHRGKIEAIIAAGTKVHGLGFEGTMEQITSNGVSFLETFPYIGPVTAYHLAKNIGLDVVKPDRHLVRLAASAGYPSPLALCEDIATVLGERLGVVDLVLWRFATQCERYLTLFNCPSIECRNCSTFFGVQ